MLRDLSAITFVDIDLLFCGRFSFIEDETLRTNVAISAQYIAFLYDLKNEYRIPGPIKYSINKTIVIYAASIVEALTRYYLEAQVNSGKIHLSSILRKSTQIKELKSIYEIDQVQKISLVKKKVVDPNWCDLDFSTCLQKSKSKGIYLDALFLDCDELRKMRNKIHLNDLADGEDAFEDDEIQKVFETLGAVIERGKKL